MTNVHKLALAGLLAATGLVGCAAGSSDEPRQTLPQYAVPLEGRLGWTVRCPLRTITNSVDMDYDIFLNADGSTKSYEQFCEENDSSTRINR